MAETLIRRCLTLIIYIAKCGWEDVAFNLTFYGYHVTGRLWLHRRQNLNIYYETYQINFNNNQLIKAYKICLKHFFNKYFKRMR